MAKVQILSKSNRGAGLGEILGIAAVLIIAAFVIIPGLRTLAGTIMTSLSNWWRDTIAGQVFPTT